MAVVDYGNIIKRLVKEVNDIHIALGQSVSNFPLYDIANENTPATITTNRNNYAPGNFDVLRLNTTTDISITGITDGKKGRFLEIINISAFKITLPHESVSSTAANRFTVVGGENIVLFPTARVRLYYDSTLQRWQIPDRPAWLGQSGVSFIAGFTATQSIPSDAVNPTQVINWTVISDDYGMFNVAGQKIIIPATGIYMGIFEGAFYPNATGYRMISWKNLTTGITLISQTSINLGGANFVTITVPMARKLNAGDEICVECLQDSGAPLNFYPGQWFLTRIY